MLCFAIRLLFLLFAYLKLQIKTVSTWKEMLSCMKLEICIPKLRFLLKSDFVGGSTVHAIESFNGRKCRVIV